MNDDTINEFASLLVDRVRDRVIRVSDLKLNQSAGWGEIGVRWRKALETATPREFAQVLIPDIVDSTIMTVLHLIDTAELRLTFESSDGRSVDVGEAGDYELCGWYYGKEGWCGKFSKQRYFDDISESGSDASQTPSG